MYDPLARMRMLFISVNLKRKRICDRDRMRSAKPKIFTIWPLLVMFANPWARKIEKYTDAIIHQISCCYCKWLQVVFIFFSVLCCMFLISFSDHEFFIN